MVSELVTLYGPGGAAALDVGERDQILRGSRCDMKRTEAVGSAALMAVA